MKTELQMELTKLDARRQEIISELSNPEFDWENINNMDDVFKVMGQEKSAFYEKYKDLADDTLAYEELKLAKKAICGNWSADWNNKEQKKWICYFKYSPSGFGFCTTHYVIWTTFTASGSRLCFEFDKQAEHFGRNFIAIHNKMLLENK